MPRADARRNRGRNTRRRLLTSALRAFGARGFDAVTTREISHAAGANQASIRYHFGGKQQLYLAVASLIAEEGRDALRPPIERSLTQAVNASSARAMLQELMSAFTRQLLKLSDDGAAASFIARELATPGAAYSTIYDLYIRDLHREVTSLLARATARHRSAHDAIVDAHALVGSALGFVAARKAFTYRSWRPTNSDDRVAAIAKRITHVAARVSDREQALPSRRSTSGRMAAGSLARKSMRRGDRRSREATAESRPPIRSHDVPFAARP
jgi:AcrR family transcriptional regulator